MRVAVTACGVLTALGDDPDALRAAVAAGASGVGPLSVPGLPGARGATIPGPKLKDWLRRRKDIKLLSRPAELLLPAAGEALKGWTGELATLGLFFGVRREPPDAGEADDAIVAAGRGGELDIGLLAGPGRDRYPPLLPLRTLPNLDLAHVSINLGIQGPTDTCSGEAFAGLQALRAAMFAVAEGRCPAALAGGAFSGVDGGSLRDRARQGRHAPPGEAAVVLRLEPGSRPDALFHLEDDGEGFDPDLPPTPWAHHRALGDCETADGLLALLLSGPGPVRAVDLSGAWAGVLRCA